MLVIEITNGQALHAEFERYGRGESFSWQGFEALFEELYGISEGGTLSIDPVGIDGDYSEVEPEDFEDYENCELIAELSNDNRLYRNF